MGSEQQVVFETTITKSIGWLDELAAILGARSQREAYTALRVGLHVLRDRLTIAELADLGAQLPMLVRGLYYDGWKPNAKPTRVRHLDDLFELVREALPQNSTLDPETVLWAVFRTISNHVPPGELRHIQQILPRSLKVFWESATVDEVRDRQAEHTEPTGWHR